MKQPEKIVIKYKETKPEKLFEALNQADEDDLKVLLAAIFLENEQSEVQTSEICKGADIDEATFGASLKFWRGAGIMSTKRASKKDTEKPQENEAPKSAHKNGKVEASELPTYATDELTALMKKRNITADYIAETSRIYGKIFNQHEVGIIVRMIDYIGFDEESVLLLLSHFAKEEPKKPLRYVEKVALALYDDGIMSPRDVEEKLRQMDAVRSVEGQIRAMFGMGSRSFTAKEKRLITAWTEKMGFDIEMIRLAYDITVDAVHEPSVSYANAILDKWHANGIDTPEKVEAEKQRRAESKASETGKSFDDDDFFEAALRRTFSDID